MAYRDTCRVCGLPNILGYLFNEPICLHCADVWYKGIRRERQYKLQVRSAVYETMELAGHYLQVMRPLD